MTTYLILGATSGIARELLDSWVREGDHCLLAARNADELGRLEEHYRACGASVDTFLWAVEGANDLQLILKWAEQRTVDRVLLAYGSMVDQDLAEEDLDQGLAMLNLTGSLASLGAVAAARLLANQPHGGELIVLGSPAGDRGRKKNFLYGASKSMLHTTVEGLQHKYAGTQVRVTLVKPGPTRTAMTAGLPQSDLADPKEVAAEVNSQLASGAPVIYAPGKWKWIMAVVKRLPRWLFHRTNF